MNKIFTILFLIALSFTSFSQVPDAISYQAIVRDGSGTVVKDKTISVRFSIIRVADDSTMVYREIHHQATDKTGLVSLMIGKGETSDSFTSIGWGTGVYYLCTEMDINGGSDYSLSSVCRMLSVPYALYAGSAQMVEGNSALSLTNVLLSGNSADSLNIIGLSAPTDQQDIANKAYVDYIMQSLIPKTPISVPTAITKNADLSGSEVTLYGHVSSDGGADVVDRGFVYGTRNSMFSDTVSCGSGKGGFSYTISGFTSYEICNYKAYGTNNEGTCYGEAMSFVVPIPSVVTSVGMGVNGIGGMAIIYGIIETDGGSDIIARGFQYGTDPSDLTETIYVDTTGYNFSYTFTGLVPGTYYYFRAFATNSNGTGYGEISEIYNSSLPYVTTLPATDVLEDRATLHGTISYIGSEVTVSCVFLYSDTDSTCFTASDVNAGTTSGDFSVVLTGLRPNTTYYCRAEVSNDEDGIMGNVISFTTQRSTTGQLAGHTWIDLGLPSGTRWATTNVGADNPEGYGDHYAWGETATKDTYNWSTYQHCNGSETTLTKYCSDESYGNEGFTDDLNILEATDDAATVNWGTGWRMPTNDEIQELVDNCDTAWTMQNGANGMLFTSRSNGNSIFLPAAGFHDVSEFNAPDDQGYYWASSLETDFSDYAWFLYFYSDGYGVGSGRYRYYGFSVRAVCDAPSAPSVTTQSANEIFTNYATLRGNITSDGGDEITQRGFVYGTDAENLTNTVQSTDVTDNFKYMLTELPLATTIYFKAYATNSIGTSYGEMQSFTTNAQFTDERDGNVYAMLTIGSQTWMAENLRYEGDISLGSELSETEPYRYYPNGDEANVATYGYLYNWFAAMNGASSSESNPSGVQGICPNGWHLPSNAEWTQLVDALGGEENAGAMLAGNATAWGATLTNSQYFGTTGFNALPAGTNFGMNGDTAAFWTATEYGYGNAAYQRTIWQIDLAGQMDSYKSYGFSVRCVRNAVNGHAYIDLGLPSGTLWATTNVGAENPEDFGDYFAWGETEPHYSVNGTDTTWLNGYEAGYDWTTYRYCNGSESTLTKYCNDSEYGDNGFTDTLTTLESTDDAATANWGTGWRMPTQEELLELYDNCIRDWTEQNGVSGYLFTGPNGNSIFLPAAGYRYDSSLNNAGSSGYYWSSSLGSSGTYYAWYLYFHSGDCVMNGYFRYRGLSVRAVCQSQN